MNIRVFASIAVSMMGLYVSFFLYELYKTTHDTPPDYLEKYNLEPIISEHLKSVKNHLLLLGIDIGIVFFSFIILITNSKKDPTEKQKNFFGKILTNLFSILILFVDYVLTNFMDQEDYSNLMYNALVDTFVLYLLFEYSNSFLFLSVLMSYDIYKPAFIYYNLLLSYVWSGINVLPNSILPEPITKWISDNNYTAKTVLLLTNSCMAMVLKSGGIYHILISPSFFKILNKEQILSTLFHELGHVYNNYSDMRIYYAISLIILQYFIFYLIYKKCINGDSKDKTSKRIFLYIFLTKLSAPILKILTYYFFHFDEFAADIFSIQQNGKTSLIEALITIDMNNQTYHNNSFIYGLMTSSHPSLISRIESIRNYS